jgi:hypothetical protein
MELFKCPQPSILSPFMALRCFEDIKLFFPPAFSESSDDLNNKRAKSVPGSVIKIMDETMSAW